LCDHVCGRCLRHNPDAVAKCRAQLQKSGEKSLGKRSLDPLSPFSPSGKDSGAAVLGKKAARKIRRSKTVAGKRAKGESPPPWSPDENDAEK